MKIEIKDITEEDLKTAFNYGKESAKEMFRDFVMDCKEDEKGNFIVSGETIADAEEDIEKMIDFNIGEFYDYLKQIK